MNKNREGSENEAVAGNEVKPNMEEQTPTSTLKRTIVLTYLFKRQKTDFRSF